MNLDEITVLSWNIEKGKTPGWKNELQFLAENVQLVLLQEAVLIDEMKESTDDTLFWSYSFGFQSKNYNSGLMTLSSVQPDLICSLQSQEPWLRSPKVASITRFQTRAHQPPMLLVNIHLINFTLGTKAFYQQLEEVVEVLKAHQGPIILSGDFNTWSQARIEILNHLTQELELLPVSFSPDHRKQVFGHDLDHILTRGFEVKTAYATEVDTSDHNPLTITLVIQQDTS